MMLLSYIAAFGIGAFFGAVAMGIMACAGKEEPEADTKHE